MRPMWGCGGLSHAKLMAAFADEVIIDGVRMMGEISDGGVEKLPDSSLENSDWTKNGSDFAFANDAEGMRKYLGSVGMSVDHFRSLPIYQRGKDVYPWLQGL